MCSSSPAICTSRLEPCPRSRLDLRECTAITIGFSTTVAVRQSGHKGFLVERTSVHKCCRSFQKGYENHGALQRTTQKSKCHITENCKTLGGSKHFERSLTLPVKAPWGSKCNEISFLCEKRQIHTIFCKFLWLVFAVTNDEILPKRTHGLTGVSVALNPAWQNPTL